MCDECMSVIGGMCTVYVSRGERQCVMLGGRCSWVNMCSVCVCEGRSSVRWGGHVFLIGYVLCVCEERRSSV